MTITIYHHLDQLLEQQFTPAVATIVRVKGSVPREVGAKMIVHPLGQHVGTVGGGCGEADVIRAGLDVIQDGIARSVTVDLTEAISMESLGVCGGVMTVFIERWHPEDQDKRALLAAILGAGDERRSIAVATTAEHGAARGLVDGMLEGVETLTAVRHGLFDGDGEQLAGDSILDFADTEVREEICRALHGREHRLLLNQPHAEARSIFIEVLAQPPHLVIAGAGHIAVPLAQIAKINDFAVTVIDDRPQYAHPARFPTADQVIAGPFREELQQLRRGRPVFDYHTYFVLVTRGHQYDIDCLLEVLDDPVAYIGMIGSQRRIRAVFELLAQEQGIAPEKFDRVFAPIGLDIGARTPAEIAVCIVAEIINLQRNGPAESLSSQLRRTRQERRARALAQAQQQ